MIYVCNLLTLVWVGIILWIVLNYIVVLGRIPWGHPVRKVFDVLAKVVEPVLRPIRAVIPPVRLGGMSLDLSPLVLIFGVGLIQRIIC